MFGNFSGGHGTFVSTTPYRSEISSSSGVTGIILIATWSIWLCLRLSVHAQSVEPVLVKSCYGKPALIATVDLAEFDALPKDRRELLENAIAVAMDLPWLPYTPRGAMPSDGGFDCSGAMYFVMRRAGLDPPRIAAEQFQWLMRNDRLHRVPGGVVDLGHPSLKDLHPGDLLFWGKPGSVEAGAKVEITHVAMFLGTEKMNKRPVMINSTDGRSYRGVKANGYGVYDFRLPVAGSRIAFIGYGTPPGIVNVSNEQATPEGSAQAAPSP